MNIGSEKTGSKQLSMSRSEIQLQSITERDKQQCPQLVYTHPIAYQAQTLQLAVQYVPVSSTHVGQSQGHLQGQYIWNDMLVVHFVGRNMYFAHQPCMIQASKACSG